MNTETKKEYKFLNFICKHLASVIIAGVIGGITFLVLYGLNYLCFVNGYGYLFSKETIIAVTAFRCGLLYQENLKDWENYPEPLKQ